MERVDTSQPIERVGPDLSTARLAEQMALLPDVRVEVGDSCAEFNQERFKQLAADRRPDPAVPSLTGKTGSRLAIRSVGNLEERINLRLEEAPNGDRADLVTPGDLYRANPLSTVARWERRAGREWVKVR